MLGVHRGDAGHALAPVTVGQSGSDELGEWTMSVLPWIAIAVVAWCVASVVTALAFGGYLRRRREATDPDGALRPLDTGPLRLWVDGSIPDTPEPLVDTAAWDAPDLPSPRTAGDHVSGRSATPPTEVAPH